MNNPGSAAAEKGTQLRSRLARVLNGDPAASLTRRRAQTWCSLFVAPCAPEGTPPALDSPAASLADLFEQPKIGTCLSIPESSRFTQSHWPVGLAGLLEFLDMTKEGWTECGGQNCFSVGHDIVFDLLDRFGQLLDQSLA